MPWDEENIDRFLEVANRAGLNSGFVPSFKAKELVGRRGSDNQLLDKDDKFDEVRRRAKRATLRGMGGDQFSIRREINESPEDFKKRKESVTWEDIQAQGWEKILQSDSAADLAMGSHDYRSMKFQRPPTLPEIIARLQGNPLDTDDQHAQQAFKKHSGSAKVISQLGKGIRRLAPGEDIWPHETAEARSEVEVDRMKQGRMPRPREREIRAGE